MPQSRTILRGKCGIPRQQSQVIRRLPYISSGRQRFTGAVLRIIITCGSPGGCLSAKPVPPGLRSACLVAYLLLSTTGAPSSMTAMSMTMSARSSSEPLDGRLGQAHYLVEVVAEHLVRGPQRLRRPGRLVLPFVS
jgi:hypothetical protein